MPSGAGLAPVPDSGPAATLLSRVLLAALRGYKILISPLFVGSCRFTPSCSDYVAEAIRVHGPLSGLRLGVQRLARCHPWGPWGFDPVPSGWRQVSVLDGPLPLVRARSGPDTMGEGEEYRMTKTVNGSHGEAARQSACAVGSSGAKVQ